MRGRRSWRGIVGTLALVAVALSALGTTADGQAPPVNWTDYFDYATMTRTLEAWAQQHKDIASVASMGKSHEGREQWAVTITNRKTGAPEDKPALYVEGGMDSDEIMATQAAMYLLHRVLAGYGTDRDITRLVDTQTLYVAPNVMPDQWEIGLKTPKRVRDSTARPYDNDLDGALDEDDQEDIDGDGHILQMRVEDPTGAFKRDPRDARVMMARQPGDGPEAGPFYRLYQTEGLDNDEDGRINEDPVGGVDPNRNWPAHWVQEYQQDWAGPHPLSEVENRNLITFFLAQPNLGAIVDLHTSGNLLYRPSSVYPDEEMDLTDLGFFRALGARYSQLTDGPVVTPLSTARARGSRGIYGAGIMIDWAYDHLGVISFAPELWAFPVDEKGKELQASEGERIDWALKHLGPRSWIDWHVVSHPQLAKVEVGGWAKPLPNNPVGAQVERIAREITDWMLHLWGQLPRLVVQEEVRPQEGGRALVRVTVRNAGYLPTNVTERALVVKSAPPVFLSVERTDGTTMLAMSGAPEGRWKGKRGLELGHLGGWGSARAGASRPAETTVDLLVAAGPRAGTVELLVDGQRAGRIRKSIAIPAARAAAGAR